MGTGNPGDITTPSIALVCCSACVLLAAAMLILVNRGAKNGVIGGLIGGSIYAGVFATRIFPTETLSLVDGTIIWAIVGGLSGMLGGGVAALVCEKVYGKSNGLINWTTAGALFGPLTMGAGATVGVSIGGIGMSPGSEILMMAIMGGAFGGTIAGASFQRRQTSKEGPKLSTK